MQLFYKHNAAILLLTKPPNNHISVSPTINLPANKEIEKEREIKKTLILWPIQKHFIYSFWLESSCSLWRRSGHLLY